MGSGEEILKGFVVVYVRRLEIFHVDVIRVHEPLEATEPLTFRFNEEYPNSCFWTCWNTVVSTVPRGIGVPGCLRDGTKCGGLHSAGTYLPRRVSQLLGNAVLRLLRRTGVPPPNFLSPRHNVGLINFSKDRVRRSVVEAAAQDNVRD